MQEIKTGEQKVTPESDPVVKPLKNDNLMPKLNIDWTKKTIGIVIGLVVAGLATGYGIYAWQNRGTVRIAGQNIEVVQSANEEGVKDASTFRDTATGTLQENDGKITKEGTHVLVRPGGVSQNVYLTSSVVDLSKYVGKNVQVWGETFKGQTAGWLMDVGRIKVVQ